MRQSNVHSVPVLSNQIMPEVLMTTGPCSSPSPTTKSNPGFTFPILFTIHEADVAQNLITFFRGTESYFNSIKIESTNKVSTRKSFFPKKQLRVTFIKGKAWKMHWTLWRRKKSSSIQPSFLGRTFNYAWNHFYNRACIRQAWQTWRKRPSFEKDKIVS